MSSRSPLAYAYINTTPYHMLLRLPRRHGEDAAICVHHIAVNISLDMNCWAEEEEAWRVRCSQPPSLRLTSHTPHPPATPKPLSEPRAKRFGHLQSSVCSRFTSSTMKGLRTERWQRNQIALPHRIEISIISIVGEEGVHLSYC